MHSRAAILMGENDLLLQGLKRILVAAKFYVVTKAISPEFGPNTLAKEGVPIALIINVRDDFNSVLEIIKNFKRQIPSANVLLFTDHNHLSDYEVIEAFRCGANGYFLNPSCDEFVKSLELVMAGEAILPATTLSLMLRQNNISTLDAIEISAPPIRQLERESLGACNSLAACSPQLSAQEQSILRCLIEGDSNKVIARKRNITEATVKVHVKAILRKTRMSNRTQVAIWGVTKGVLLSCAEGQSSVARN